jgi:hypothetical protein
VWRDLLVVGAAGGEYVKFIEKIFEFKGILHQLF